jgi:hypothetical protein
MNLEQLEIAMSLAAKRKLLEETNRFLSEFGLPVVRPRNNY